MVLEVQDHGADLTGYRARWARLSRGTQSDHEGHQDHLDRQDLGDWKRSNPMKMILLLGIPKMISTITTMGLKILMSSLREPIHWVPVPK